MTAPPLRLTAVTKLLGGRPVLRDVAFDCDPGTVTALLGPNGAGKTTAVGIATGLRHTDRGQAEVCGIPAADLAARLHVSVVPQDIALPECISLARCVSFVAAHRPDRHRTPPVDQLCMRLGVTDLLPRRLGGLSGGQRRRAMLVLGLAHAPELLVLDEATTNLDDRSRAEVWALVHEYTERGGATLVTSHLLAEIDAHADHVVALHDGRVVHQGPLAEVRARFGTSTVSVTVAASDSARALAVVAQAQHGEVADESGPGRLSWHTRRPAELVAGLVGAGISIAALAVRPTPLSDLLAHLVTPLVADRTPRPPRAAVAPAGPARHRR